MFPGIASLSVADRLSETRTGNLPLGLSKVSWREGQEPNDSECKRRWRMEVGCVRIDSFSESFAERRAEKWAGMGGTMGSRKGLFKGEK